MKISRWMAEVPATRHLIQNLLERENLEPKEVHIEPGKKLVNLRSQMTEIIQLFEGEVIFNLSGTQFVLRPGDRLQIGANTLYSLSNMRDSTAHYFIAKTI